MGRHSIPDPDDADEQPEGGFDGGGFDSGFGDGGRADDAGYGSAPDYRSGADDGASEFRDFGYDTGNYDSAGDDADNHEAGTYGSGGYGAGSYDADFYDADGYGADGDRDDAGLAAADQPTHAFAVSDPAAGRGSNWENGEWTGSHRAVTTQRRGVSRSVIIALVGVVVIVGAVILWRFFGDALSDRSQVAAARCVEGELTVSVVADPAIADQVTTLGERYSETAAPVGDRCVKIAVKSADADAVVNGFVGPWPAELGERPALWIPASSVSQARLEAAAGPTTVSNSRSLVTSPVVLAIRPELKEALAEQNWSTLPALQNNPNSLDALNLPGWGELKLSLPRTDNSDAAYLAAEAVASAAAPDGAPATAGVGAAQRLLAGQPELSDTRASTALDALVNAENPASASVHAVATTEQRLFQRGTNLQDAGEKLTSWIPPGPTATADFPAALLSGDWLNKEQVSAASEFDRFMRKPEQLAELANAGFRAEGVDTPDSTVTDFGSVSEPLSIGDADTRATLATTLSAPAQGGVVTLMVNQSMPADEGGQTRLANVATALNDRLQALPPTSSVGLWTFDGVAGRSVLSTGPLSEDVGGGPRSAALSSSLDGQVASSGGAVSFTTLRLIYGEALANFREGEPNSVLVITAGPHTDQSLDGSGLVDYIRGAADPQRPVAVNVINLGDDPDRPTWEAVAQASGGEYRQVPSSNDPGLAEALSTMLG